MGVEEGLLKGWSGEEKGGGGSGTEESALSTLHTSGRHKPA